MASRRAGMTFMELVIGLTITALAVGAGYIAVSALADARERARVSSDALVRTAAARRALVAWLEGAYVAPEPQSPPFRVVDHVHRGQPDDEMSFLTSAATPLGSGDVVVRLFVDRDDRTIERGLTAELMERYGPRTVRVSIDSTIVALDVRCLSEVLGKREWMYSWLSPALVPQGIELRVAAVTSSRLAPLLRIPLTVALLGGR